MVRRCSLRQPQHEFVWSTGHFNICAPRPLYQSCGLFVTVILAMQYVSFSPEKQFPDVETGQKKKRLPHPMTKSYISFKIFPVLPVQKPANLAPKSENISLPAPQSLEDSSKRKKPSFSSVLFSTLLRCHPQTQVTHFLSASEELLSSSSSCHWAHWLCSEISPRA